MPALRKVKVLFVCSHNLHRSLTAHAIYQKVPGYDVLSAGTERGANVMLTEKLIKWADFIFVMEDYHAEVLRVRFGDLLRVKPIINLEIPDNYGTMDNALIDLIRSKMRSYVPMMALKTNGRYYLQD